MAAFRTFFRTVVMLATLGIVAKLWYLHGPSVAEMKTIGSRVVEVTTEAWNNYWQKPNDSALADDPRLPSVGQAPAPFVPSGVPMEPIQQAPAVANGAPNPGTVQLAGGVPAEIVPLAPAAPSTAWPQQTTPEPQRLPPDRSASADGPRLTTTLNRLVSLGMRDQQLTAWGGRGEFTRFSCTMPWTNSPAFSRHFEAVAATPLAAVEQVAAEIDAWQRGQR